MSLGTVVFASDHAGFALKQALVHVAKSAGHTVEDLGPANAERVDYPDFADKVATRVKEGDSLIGVLVCGSGIGMSMRANRHAGIRAANCTHVWQAEATRAHNNANVLCLGERIVGPGLAERILQAFLTTPFEGGRHEARVAKIDAPRAH